MLCWFLVTTGANIQPWLRAGPLLTAGITTVGTNAYPYTNKPVAGSQINRSRPLAASLVPAVPLNEGGGTNFYDAVSQESYAARTLPCGIGSASGYQIVPTCSGAAPAAQYEC